jgi:hypothetical protein
MGEEHEHEGTFAEGQEREEHHPEREARGRFADDMEEHRHEGTFAEGQERDEHHAERERHGDFAEGQET